jgi:thiol-disulfide isomerase/thioredoxin
VITRLAFCWVLVLTLAWALPAHAQFDKTTWPARQVTPLLNVQDLQGQRWSADQLKGRVVVLNFWATWCAPCKEELPSLQTLHEISGGNPLVIGVNVREPAARVKRYLQATGLDFPVVLDPQGELAKQWGVTVYPTTILMGPDGKAQWRVKGDVDWSGPEAQRWLQSMLSPMPNPIQR